MQRRLWLYGSISRPFRHVIGCPRKITRADEKRLFDFLVRNPTVNQEEMTWFLWEECGIQVNQSTVSRVLKRLMWLRKKARRIARKINDELRRAYMVDMAGILAEQMVFLDESMFNETTGWRLTAWAPIGEAARYTGNMNRGYTWNFLTVYTTTGYLPCYVTREGYFNTETFLQWLEKELLSHCHAYPGLNSVIVLDNASAYCD
jgi:hypothetical protein